MRFKAALKDQIKIKNKFWQLYLHCCFYNNTHSLHQISFLNTLGLLSEYRLHFHYYGLLAMKLQNKNQSLHQIFHFGIQIFQSDFVDKKQPAVFSIQYPIIIFSKLMFMDRLVLLRFFSNKKWALKATSTYHHVLYYTPSETTFLAIWFKLSYDFTLWNFCLICLRTNLQNFISIFCKSTYWKIKK